MKANCPVICGLAARGHVRMPVEDLPQFRRKPGPHALKDFPSALLKHPDEQTLAGLAAVFQAIHEHHLSETDFCSWGVLGAPLFLGRNTVGAALARFTVEGAWGVSPHLIPHRSLHSVSGTISQALKIHGPNFGVAGGPGAATEILLNAAALLQGQHLPGVWVVLTQVEPELAPLPSGQPVPGTAVVGLALALVPWLAGSSLTRLRIGVNGQKGRSQVLTLAELQDCLTRSQQGRTPLTVELDHGARLELEYPAERFSEAAVRLLAWSEKSCPLPPSSGS